MTLEELIKENNLKDTDYLFLHNKQEVECRELRVSSKEIKMWLGYEAELMKKPEGRLYWIKLTNFLESERILPKEVQEVIENAKRK